MYRFLWGPVFSFLLGMYRRGELPVTHRATLFSILKQCFGQRVSTSWGERQRNRERILRRLHLSPEPNAGAQSYGKSGRDDGTHRSDGFLGRQGRGDGHGPFPRRAQPGVAVPAVTERPVPSDRSPCQRGCGSGLPEIVVQGPAPGFWAIAGGRKRQTDASVKILFGVAVKRRK